MPIKPKKFSPKKAKTPKTRYHLPRDLIKQKSDSENYNYRWQQLRLKFLHHNPLCINHKNMGLIKIAVDIDHIIPIKINSELQWDESNWQALCHECHSRKTNLENKLVGGGI